MIKVIFPLGLVVIAFCNADSNMESYARDCATENNLNLNSMTDPKVRETQDFKCFTKCIAIKSDFMTAEGVPNIEQIKKDYKIKDDDPILENYKKCGEEATDEDLCDKVMSVYKCIRGD